MPHRYFTTQFEGLTASLTGDDAHHLATVMRAKPGDTVILCDGNAVEYTATVSTVSPDLVTLQCEPGYPSVAEPTVEAHLFVGYPKQGKLEEIIEHSVELGVSRVIPFFSRYCVAAPKNEEKKNTRYNRVAFEAAKQCGRGRIPEVELPLNRFAEVCARFAEYDLVLFCYEGGGIPMPQLVAQAVPAADRLKVAIITGAEGGFSTQEAQQASEAGARTVTLGPRILRCETAPLAALSVLMSATNNLQ